MGGGPRGGEARRDEPAPDGDTLTAAGDTARRSVASRGSRRESIRTCLGCRERAPRSVLLRVVAAEVGGVWCAVPDPLHRSAGRGASLHLDPVCLDLAERRRAFARALRRSESLDLTALRAYVDAAGRPSGVAQRPRGGSPTRTVRAGSGSEADEHPMSTQP